MRNEIGLTIHTRAILANPPKPYDYKDDPRDQTMGCAGLIKKYMPDFCWLSFQDLLKMLEWANPDVDEETLCVTLSRFKKEGKVVTKPWGNAVSPNSRGPKPLLYMRVS